MKPIRWLLIWVMAAVPAAALAAPAALLIGSPDTEPSLVDPLGTLQEDWGAVGLQLEQPAGASLVGQRYEVAPVPTVETTIAGGGVMLAAAAYRAPIWPQDVDVLSARVRNSGSSEVTARLRVTLPEQGEIGERTVTVNRRVVLGLPLEPAPLREEREWGCTGGVVPMPGWAKPKRECDPAFRNISAGMGGVPIVYRFRVPAGAKRTVVLGLCESHWAEAGVRPLVLRVEGAPKTEIDPIGAWGRHEPGCLRFEASDANKDGRLEIAVDPHPNASDRNTILNVIWVFPPDARVKTDDVLRGSMSAGAEYYVDVGGERDQLLYESRPLRYELKLAPGAARELTFVVARRGGSAPDLGASAWTPERLRRSAEEVWGDWFARGARVRLPEPHATRWHSALAQIMMTRAQADAFFAAPPSQGGLEQFSYRASAHIVAALDYAGQHAEAERMLRLYWDRPAPKAFASLAQGDDGCWRDPVKDQCAPGFAMEALARHALLTADGHWGRKAWPAMAAGAEWFGDAQRREGSVSAEAQHCWAVGLVGAARVAELLGRDEAKRLDALAHEFAPTVTWRRMEDDLQVGPIAQAAQEVARIRDALVVERGAELWLLDGLDAFDLQSGRLSAEGLPTEFGRVSLALRRAGKALQLGLELAPQTRAPEALVVRAPMLDGRRAVRVEIDGRQAGLAPEGTVRVSGALGKHQMAFFYR